tara:strand:- start:97 stop:348 length:252 start_codon:yes stop_codon:yes gene_type:complete
MASWQVKLRTFPSSSFEDFCRVWRKHGGGKDDAVIARSLRALRAGSGEPPVIAEYGEKETAERVIEEVENLAGDAELIEVPDP